MLSIGSTYQNFSIRIAIHKNKLNKDYFQKMIKEYPENIVILKSTHGFWDYDMHVTFEPSDDSEWQEIIFNNSIDVSFTNKPNIFSSVSHAIDKIKEFKILKKTTKSLLLCQFGKYEKFLVYTNSSEEECKKIYEINIANRDNRLFRNINEKLLVAIEE
ncbi:hypothetical protein [Acinetobacter soli]|uniref:hypothetical protein n=1 Tax=Acinetobacter soli TaxID=487316 RepID=UPI002FF0F2A1|nr:hypothetical protein PX669_10030 [Acinetobacter soli]